MGEVIDGVLSVAWFAIKNIYIPSTSGIGNINEVIDSIILAQKRRVLLMEPVTKLLILEDSCDCLFPQ